MKMLKMSSYFYPENTASSHLTKNLDEAYKEAGIVTEVFVPTPTRGISKEVREKYKKIKYEEMEDGSIIVHRFSMFRERKNPIQRAFRYILVNIIQYFKAGKAKDVDLIRGGSTPPTQGLLCAAIKKKLSKKYKRNVPFVYNLQDIFPDSLVHTGLTKKGSLLWKIGRKMEDKIYAAADKIVVISEGFKQNIMEKGVPEDKIVIIENWIDTNEVLPVAREDNILFEKFGLDPSKFYICYSGNVGHTQNMDMLLDTAKRVAEANADIHFVIIGEGAAKAHVAERVASESIANVHMFPFEDYKNISHVFSLGDMGLIISKAGVGSNSVPSKTWSIMSASRPVLASFDKGGDLDRVITENGAGVCIDPADAEGFYQAILSAFDHREELASWGKNGRAYVETHLTREIGTGNWVKLMTSFDPEKAEKKTEVTVE